MRGQVQSFAAIVFGATLIFALKSIQALALFAIPEVQTLHPNAVTFTAGVTATLLAFLASRWVKLAFGA